MQVAQTRNGSTEEKEFLLKKRLKKTQDVAVTRCRRFRRLVIVVITFGTHRGRVRGGVGGRKRERCE